MEIKSMIHLYTTFHSYAESFKDTELTMALNTYMHEVNNYSDWAEWKIKVDGISFPLPKRGTPEFFVMKLTHYQDLDV